MKRELVEGGQRDKREVIEHIVMVGSAELQEQP
jgi:hypothetical protein